MERATHWFFPGAHVGFGVSACLWVGLGRVKPRRRRGDDPASRSEPEAADVTCMGTVKPRPAVMAPVRRRGRLRG